MKIPILAAQNKQRGPKFDKPGLDDNDKEKIQEIKFM